MRPADNPFRTGRLHALRFRLDEAGWSGLLARFDGLGRRAALVGPHGTGKTTLQRELAARLAAAGMQPRHLRFTSEHRPDLGAALRAVAGCGPRDLVVVDGAEQLGRWAWWRLLHACRKAGGLLITSHRPGLLPTLRRHAGGPALLADLVAELAGADALDPGAAAALVERHRGDLRACLRELYDRWSEKQNPPG